MKRLKVTPRQLLGGVAIVLALAFLALSFVLYRVEEARISNLRDALASSRAEIVDNKATDQAAFASLLRKYSNVYQQLANTGETPTSPAPSTIVGPKGEPGASPSFAELFSVVADYCSSGNPTPCQGPPGKNGADGAPGVGTPGANGTNGTNGADGVGLPGRDGTNGVDGAPGQPPVSWTYDDVLGMTHTCTRTDPFDASAPTYQCT